MSLCDCCFLFLDFDGVLHDDPEDFSELACPFEHVLDFEASLRSADPEARIKIVISSSWRHDENLHELRAHFASDIAERIIDVTPMLQVQVIGWGIELSKGHRQLEIETWLAQNAPASRWLALDDKLEGFETNCENLLLIAPHSDEGRGLNQFSLRELRERLGEMLQGPRLTSRRCP